MAQVSSHNPPKPLQPVKPGRNLPYLALGGDGHLRAESPSVLEAENDLEAAAFWLLDRGGGSQSTKTSYWLHIERLLLWAAETKGKALSDLTVNDLAEFRDFLRDPQPRDTWCGPRAPRGSWHWRPFRGPLSPASQRLSLDIIGSLFAFLAAAGYLRANPMLMLRKPRAPRRQGGIQERFLDESLLQAVTVTLDRMPQHTAAQIAAAERTRWLFILLTTLGLRRDEVVRHTHAAFERRMRPTGEQWWCRIIGKGGHERVIPAPPVCIEALRRYRRHLGLEEDPLPADDTPLVRQLRGGNGASDTTLYRAIKKLLEDTAARITGEHPHGAAQLRRASPHWLRHSYVTAMGNLGASLRHLNRSAGHASIETTAQYDHASEDAWHQDMERTPLDGWALGTGPGELAT